LMILTTGTISVVSSIHDGFSNIYIVYLIIGEVILTLVALITAYIYSLIQGAISDQLRFNFHTSILSRLQKLMERASSKEEQTQIAHEFLQSEKIDCPEVLYEKAKELHMPTSIPETLQTIMKIPKEKLIFFYNNPINRPGTEQDQPDIPIVKSNSTANRRSLDTHIKITFAPTVVGKRRY